MKASPDNCHLLLECRWESKPEYFKQKNKKQGMLEITRRQFHTHINEICQKAGHK